MSDRRKGPGRPPSRPRDPKRAAIVDKLISAQIELNRLEETLHRAIHDQAPDCEVRSKSLECLLQRTLVGDLETALEFPPGIEPGGVLGRPGGSAYASCLEISKLFGFTKQHIFRLAQDGRIAAKKLPNNRWSISIESARNFFGKNSGFRIVDTSPTAIESAHSNHHPDRKTDREL